MVESMFIPMRTHWDLRFQRWGGKRNLRPIERCLSTWRHGNEVVSNAIIQHGSSLSNILNLSAFRRALLVWKTSLGFLSADNCFYCGLLLISACDRSRSGCQFWLHQEHMLAFPYISNKPWSLFRKLTRWRRRKFQSTKSVGARYLRKSFAPCETLLIVVQWQYRRMIWFIGNTQIFLDCAESTNWGGMC